MFAQCWLMFPIDLNSCLKCPFSTITWDWTIVTIYHYPYIHTQKDDRLHKDNPNTNYLICPLTRRRTPPLPTELEAVVGGWAVNAPSCTSPPPNQPPSHICPILMFPIDLNSCLKWPFSIINWDWTFTIYQSNLQGGPLWRLLLEAGLSMHPLVRPPPSQPATISCLPSAD